MDVLETSLIFWSVFYLLPIALIVMVMAGAFSGVWLVKLAHRAAVALKSATVVTRSAS